MVCNRLVGAQKLVGRDTLFGDSGSGSGMSKFWDLAEISISIQIGVAPHLVFSITVPYPL